MTRRLECFCESSCSYFGIKFPRSGGVLSFPDAYSSSMFFFFFSFQTHVCVSVCKDWQSNLVFNIQSEKENTPIISEQNFRKLPIVWLFLSDFYPPVKQFQSFPSLCPHLASLLSSVISPETAYTFLLTCYLLALFLSFCYSDYACPFSSQFALYFKFVSAVKQALSQETESKRVSFYATNTSLPTFPTLHQLEDVLSL